MKTIYKFLSLITVIVFTAGLSIANTVPVILPKIEETTRKSVDTAKHNVVFYSAGQIASTVSTAGAFILCTISGWSEACDADGNVAGIDTIWFANKNDVASLTISSRQVTAITMVSTKTFFKWQFQPDTAFFNQARNVVNKQPRVKQTITFINPKIKTSLLIALEKLDACALCGLVAIIKDNNGKFWLAGVRVNPSAAYSFVGLFPAQSEGAVTGANTESDENKITTAFEANTGYYAIESTVAEASIPVPA